MDAYIPLSQLMPSRDYLLKIDGEEVFVYHTEVASYAIFSTSKAEVEVEVVNCAINPIFKAVVRPLSLGVAPVKEEGKSLLETRSLYFKLPVPARVSVELDGRLDMPLFIFLYPEEEDTPDENGPGVIFYKKGGIYEAGEIVLSSNQTLYIEEGARVYGHVKIDGAENVRICGRGVLDGSRYPMAFQGGLRAHLILAEACKGLRIEDLTLVDGNTWHLLPAGCDGVAIKGVNIIGRVRSGDGIDICGCENVLIEGCFVRVHDDCICIKAIREKGSKNVRNVEAKNCVLFNCEGGNGIEIGYETRCEEISDIWFHDCDIIHCFYEGLMSGGALTIHNGDRAHVHHVLYEDIRVEDAQEKLVDIKMQTSSWNVDKQCGPVTDITFRNIKVADGPFPVSIVKGWGFDERVKRIRFEDIDILGRKIANWRDMRMVLELYEDVSFSHSAVNPPDEA